MYELGSSAIIAAIISASIALGVFFYRERKVEPQKWKRDAKLDTLYKQLEAYGELLTLLQATREKAKRQDIGKEQKMTHLFELPFDSERLREIFQKKRYLFTQNIVDQYLKIEREDTRFLLKPRSGREDNNWITDLSEMQDFVELGFKSLKDEFEKITDYKLD